MKKILILFLLVASFSLTFSSDDKVAFTDLIQKDGLVYFKSETIPFSGTAVSYYPDGKVQDLESYKDGLKNGKWISYHKNNTVWAKGKYVRGTRDGEHIWFDTSGKLVKVRNYEKLKNKVAVRKSEEKLSIQRSMDLDKLNEIKKIEEERLALEAKKIEEERIAKLEAKKEMEEKLALEAKKILEKKLALKAKKDKEAQLALEAKKIEEENLALKAKKIEDKRLALEAKKVEEERIAKLEAESKLNKKLKNKGLVMGLLPMLMVLFAGCLLGYEKYNK